MASRRPSETSAERQADRLLIEQPVRAQVLALTSDFARVWQDLHTTDQDRKRVVRLLIEDVTLLKTHEVTLQVRWRGGAEDADDPRGVAQLADLGDPTGSGAVD